MLNQLQVKNISSMFDIFDCDRNGVIQRTDFQAISAKVAGGLRLEPDSEFRSKLNDCYLSWWQVIRSNADVDSDGDIGRNEYLMAAEKGMFDDSAYLDAVLKVADTVFAAADRDGDGVLTREEFIRIYDSVDVGPVAAGAFEQIDLDGDGLITREEFRAASVGLFTCANPEVMGANMLGKA